MTPEQLREIEARVNAANVEFIAHAREDVTLLLAYVKELEQELREQEDRLWT